MMSWEKQSRRGKMSIRRSWGGEGDGEVVVRAVRKADTRSWTKAEALERTADFAYAPAMCRLSF